MLSTIFDNVLSLVNYFPATKKKCMSFLQQLCYFFCFITKLAALCIRKNILSLVMQVKDSTYKVHSKSLRNRMLVFKWCIVHHEFVPRGRIINAAYYIEVLTHLRENVRRRRPQKWKDGWILHHDNAPSHMAMAVQQFLAEKKITLMPQPPYTPPTLHCVTSGCSLN
jgi:hypothetical protein